MDATILQWCSKQSAIVTYIFRSLHNDEPFQFLQFSFSFQSVMRTTNLTTFATKFITIKAGNIFDIKDKSSIISHHMSLYLHSIITITEESNSFITSYTNIILI